MSLHMILYLVLVVILFFVLWALVMAWMEMRSPSLQSRTRVPEVLPRESRRRLSAVSNPNAPAAEVDGRRPRIRPRSRRTNKIGRSISRP